MVNFIEKVGNITIYIEKNVDRSITVAFTKGTRVIMRETYFTNNQKAAINDLFRKMDIYTVEWLWLNIDLKDLKQLSKNTYLAGEKDYFCRIDDTKYFKHFYKSADEFIPDKNGMRIIDR